MLHKTERVAIWSAGAILFHTYPLSIASVGFPLSATWGRAL